MLLPRVFWTVQISNYHPIGNAEDMEFPIYKISCILLDATIKYLSNHACLPGSQWKRLTGHLSKMLPVAIAMSDSFIRPLIFVPPEYLANVVVLVGDTYHEQDGSQR